MGIDKSYFGETGATVLDDVSGLIPLYITTRDELYEAEYLNVTSATQYYFANSEVINNFEITRKDLFDVHKRMFDEVWSWAGKKRKSDKNIGIQAHKIDEEIQKLLGDFSFWQNEKIDLIELGAKLHHRLVWIHPFEGGNGRWARFVTNIIYYKGKNSLLKWPEDEMQLKAKSTFRERYLSALKEADKGNFKKLIEIHKEIA